MKRFNMGKDPHCLNIPENERCLGGFTASISPKNVQSLISAESTGPHMSSSSLILQLVRQRAFQVLTFVIIALLPAVLVGQAYFGTVSGLFSDPSGAVVQGASVVLADEEKGYKFTAKSDTSGRYLFVSIPPGLYSVTAEMTGFEKTVRTHIKLNVTENASANLTLKIAGGRTQSVEVKAQTQTIATEDAVTGTVIDRRAINDLPLIDRYALDLVYLTPGVTDMSDANSVAIRGRILFPTAAAAPAPTS